MTTANLLPEVFFNKSNQLAREKAFYYCRPRDKKWVEMTWRKYQEEVCLLAGWLQSKGVKKGDKVALLSANRPEWLISDIAIMSIGAISIPVYATSSEADITYILDHSEAKLLLVDTLERAAPAAKAKLEGILVFDKPGDSAKEPFSAPIFDISDAHKAKDTAIEKPVDLDQEDIATIIYTSGTTGKPKGVIHTHGNFVAMVPTVFDVLKQEGGAVDRFFSFLPLSHVAERILVQVGSIVTGSEVAFARNIDTLAEDLVRCRPTILLCVPRLWEKIYEKINNGLLTASPVKKAVFGLAKALGQVRIEGTRINRKHDETLRAKVSDILVGNKLKKRLGLDACRMLVTGAAPTRPEVMKFFGTFGMLIREVYGLTENLCLGVLNDYDESVIGSCGKVFMGNEIKIADDDEIMFRAPWMFKGYYKMPEETAKVLDKDGWFGTGDLGKLDNEGRLSIVGRKKELLKTSGGKYVAPVPIEDSLKAISVVQDAMIIGDNQKYCVALVSLDAEVVADKSPESFKQELSQHLEDVNRPLASFESIKRIGVMKESFSVESGSLTPTLKVKRKVVTEQQESFINQIYSSDDELVIFDEKATG
ncbi:MAG: long-chain fatty acid--CoA ligase [Pseudobacteriovorax sp.]|nr:long-chain fatty acid--CoA ligase [Pseudobacteriovorax sp.]